MVDLQVGQDINSTAQFINDGNGHSSQLSLSTVATGIGTASPRSNLDVVGPAPTDANNGQLRIAEENGHVMLLGRAASYAFIQSHNREPLILNPLGNRVGIGTTNPAELLDVNGSIRVADDVILTRADCAEEFDVDPVSYLEPGTVMVIGTGQRLQHCSQIYDRRVAGIISGMGDQRPGIILGRCPSSMGRLRIALALIGTVLCKVDATRGEIESGDLLTTSSTPGHAMRATDQTRSFGAVVGKALEGLAGGTGIIPVLVTLQ